MAFYYCRDDGTATANGGRYDVEKANNSWDTEFTLASEFYDSIESAMNATTEPGASDFIYVSSASAFSKGSAISLTLAFPPDSPILCYSVDDSAINDFLAGATELTGGSNLDFNFTTTKLSVAMYGITIGASDDVQLAANEQYLLLVDGALRLQAANSRLSLGTSNSSVEMIRSDFISDVGTSAEIMRVQEGARLSVIGGSFIATSGSVNDYIGSPANNGGGGVLRISGQDLSAMPSGSFLLGNMGGSRANDGVIDFHFDDCQLNSAAGIVEEVFTSPRHQLLLTNCSGVSSEAEYQFFQRTWAGDVEDEDSSGIVRTESTAFEDGEKVSMLVTTVADCGPGRPLKIELPARFAELSVASTDTIRVYFAQPNTQIDLTDANFYAKLIYPDGTVKNQYNIVTNQATLLTAGTQHTDDSGSSTWEDDGVALTAHDEYRMDISTSSDVGHDSVPRIIIYIESSDATIHIDTTVDVVA